MNDLTPSRQLTLSVIVPIYNELNTWSEILDRLRALHIPSAKVEIVLVDDASTDGTREQLQNLAKSIVDSDDGERLRIIFHPQNRGKGAALRTGFASAGGDVVVPQDADLEYDPQDLPALLEPIRTGQADAVFGCRFTVSKNRRGHWINYLANRFLTGLSNLTTGFRLTDMETCYKMVRKDVLADFEGQQDRFGFEPEITAYLARVGARVIEVPISYNPRSKKQGKKIGWRDGLAAIRCILEYRPRRRDN